ncbi:response regulator [Methylobacter psychrophilus]|uniref:response regulator n=1 Tax=Methylobacter psychrophilus TaxID=96941 RepID=UPI0021D4CA29|nr:response regulator [Methylobacter psychrophilus]
MKTILVVDDDVFQHQIINNALRDESYKIISRFNGESALTLLFRERPDLILMDINMPDYNGMEILQKIKSYKHLTGVPIVMITNIQAKDMVMESLQKGAVNYIVKPFTRYLLIEKVRAALAIDASDLENTNK